MGDMRRLRGFTLIELLVALAVLVMLGLLSWQGIAGMARTREATAARGDALITLQASLAQWQADLDAATALPNQSAIRWDGLALLIIRHGADPRTPGLVVSAWTRRTLAARPGDLAATAPREGVAAVQGPYWMRWQSPPVTTRGELQSALAQASQWAQSPGADDRLRETALIPLADWQVFFYRNDAWTNPQSSSGTAAEALPGGVRAVLVLPGGDGLSGRLVRDWVRPNLSVSRS
jgi:general secretion pathway protein J